MNVKVISPEGQIFSGETDAVTLPGEKGSFQILKMHAPIVSTLSAGEVKIHCNGAVDADAITAQNVRVEGENIFIKVNGGVVKSAQDDIVVLAD